MNFPRKRLMLGFSSLAMLLLFWFLQRLLAPIVDPSTPADQNGYSLLAYNPQEQISGPPSRIFLVRWLQGVFEKPTDWYNNRAGLVILVPDHYLNGFLTLTAHTVTATASTGDKFPLRYTETGTANQQKPQIVVLVDLPKGYPDTYQWLDVNIRDKKGHAARWRLRKLPRQKPAVLPGTGSSSVSVAGTVVEGRAWWDPHGQKYPDSSRAPQNETRPLNVEVRAPWPANRPNASPTSYWRLKVDKVEPEWQAVGSNALDSSYSVTGSLGSNGSSINSRPMWADAELFPTPCAAAQSVARVNGRVIVEDRASEAVSLEGLPLKRTGEGFILASSAPTLLRTKSGIVVRVSAVTAAYFHEPLSPNEVRFRVTLPGGETKIVVPGSKLYKRYRKSLKIHQNVDWNDKNQISMTQGSDYQTVAFRRPLTSLKMPPLTLTVTQTAELSTVPFTLVLTVKKGHPAQRWDAP